MVPDTKTMLSTKILPVFAQFAMLLFRLSKQQKAPCNTADKGVSNDTTRSGSLSNDMLLRSASVTKATKA